MKLVNINEFEKNLHEYIDPYEIPGAMQGLYDAMEDFDLVRCGECKWCEKRETANYIPFLYCLSEGISVKDTDYCSWGEWRE